MPASHERNLYYKFPISKELEKKLTEKGIDIERFQRDVALKAIEHPKTESAKKGKDFALTKDIINELIASQQAMLKAQGPQHLIRDDKTRAANERLAKLRDGAHQARQKAKSYSGKFEEQTKSEQEKTLSMLKDVSNQSTVGMTPVHYALKTVSDIIVRLEEHAKGRAYAQGLVKSLAKKFAEQEKTVTETIAILEEKAKERERRADAQGLVEGLFEKEETLNGKIAILEYAKNCQKILEASAVELKKPQTFSEATRDFIFNSLRTIFNVLDRLYTWAMSKEKTFAEDTTRKSYIPVPKTALAAELEAIQSEFPHFKKELTGQLETSVANAEKRDARKERVAAAKVGKHPEQDLIDSQIAVARDAKQSQARLRAHLLGHAKRFKASETKSRHEKQERKLVDLVTGVVRKELLNCGLFNQTPPTKRRAIVQTDSELHENETRTSFIPTTP